jgi:hypothetical protein
MGQQLIEGGFPDTQDFLANFPVWAPRRLPIALEDGNGAVSGPVATGQWWTTGFSYYRNLSLQPPLGQAWTLVACTFSFNGYVIYRAFGQATPAVFTARWGKLIGAILGGTQQVATPGGGTFSTVSGGSYGQFTNVPTTTLAQQTLWDGSTDPLFPPISANGGGFIPGSWPIFTTIQPPIPIDLQAVTGQTVTLALFLTPSLLAGAQWALIANARYQLTIDDGLPTSPTP